MKTALVTGATGFVGLHLCSRLIREGVRVVGTSLKGAPRTAIPRVALVPVDIRNGTDVRQVIQKCRPREIYHLAAQSSDHLSWAQSAETMEANAGGTYYVLEMVRRYAPDCKVLIVSSAQVFARRFARSEPCQDEDWYWPVSPYGFSKALSEMIAKDYAFRHGVKVVVARSFNHVGIGQSPNFVFSDWCHQIAKAESNGKKPRLSVGNIAVKRDMLHVDDVIDAYRLLMRKGKSGSVYNVSSGKSESLRKYAQYLVRRARRKIGIHAKPGKQRKNDTPDTKTKPVSLRKLGWKPKRTLYQALDEMLEDCRRKAAA